MTSTIEPLNKLSGDIDEEKNELEETLSYINQQLTIKGPDIMLLSYKATILSDLGRYEEAIGCCEIGSSVEPDRIAWYFRKADFLEELGLIDQVMELYDNLIQYSANWNLAEIYRRKIDLLINLNRPMDVLKCMNLLISMDSHNPDNYLRKLNHLLDNKMEVEAADFLTTAIANFTWRYDFLEAKADILFRLGRGDEAFKYLGKIIHIFKYQWQYQGMSTLPDEYQEDTEGYYYQDGFMNCLDRAVRSILKVCEGVYQINRAVIDQLGMVDCLYKIVRYKKINLTVCCNIISVLLEIGNTEEALHCVKTILKADEKREFVPYWKETWQNKLKRCKTGSGELGQLLASI